MKSIFPVVSNMKTRIYTLVTLAVLFSTAVASIFAYIRYTADLRAKVSLTNQQLLQQVADNLDSYFDDLRRLSLVPAYNAALVEQLEKSNGSFSGLHLQLENRRYIENFLDEMMIYPRQDILHAFLIVDQQVFYGSRVRPSIDRELDPTTLDWYSRIRAASGGPIYLGPHNDPLLKNDPTVVFSVVNIIRSLKNDCSILAYIKINADFSVINNICQQVDLGSGSGILLVDDLGHEVFRSAPQGTPQELAALSPGQHLATEEGEFLVYRMNLPSCSWTLYGLVDQNDLQQSALSTSRLSLLIGAGCAALTLLLLLLALKALLAPLYKIIRLVHQLGQGNFQVHFPDQRRDEIGLMGRSMNEVVQQLEQAVQDNARLENRVIRAQLVEKEAQVSMLYSQIQPHFIYNTMNMISMLIQLGRGEAAVQNIQRLSLLLRSMSKSNSIHSLAQECRLLEAYLEIQISRYGPNLSYEIQLPSELKECQVPALLLQPLVENAVIHGCEENGRPVHIRISLFHHMNKIVAQVQDDGTGMEPEVLACIRRRIQLTDEEWAAEPAVSGGTGLHNVNRRIQIRYGLSYGVSIESTPGMGTIATVCFPRQKEE